MSGLSVIGINYAARLNNTLAFTASSSYFVLSDLGTVQGYPIDFDNEGFCLGPEFYASVSWGPMSDLRFSAGFGIFVPALGNVAASDEKTKWQFDLSATISLY